MKRITSKDTIVAISTPIGEGGIGIVRLSGPLALPIADKVFRGKNGKLPSQLPTYTIHYGHIVNGNRILDEVILTVMRAPRSYTREDVVEINCHGGILPLKSVLELVLRKGARLAEPGEFTKRAFLRGRIDLAQAEAVVDVIRARTDLSLKVALSQLQGRLSEQIEGIKEGLLNLIALLEAAIDFPEEEVNPPSREEVEKEIREAEKEVSALLRTAREGRIIQEGLSVAIVGRPNVGKSTLMNALLKEERVIVTPVPGTTRDTVEDMVSLRNIPVKFIDTAGIREHRDLVEKEGIKRSREAIARADLVLFVVDGSEGLDKEDYQIWEEVKHRETLLVLNKVDLPLKTSPEELKKVFPGKRVVRISALTGKGLTRLETAIEGMVWRGEVSGEPTFITRARHKEALTRAGESLGRARHALRKGLSEEFIVLDLREALTNLDSIIGETTTEDILERIFAEFCIGK